MFMVLHILKISVATATHNVIAAAVAQWVRAIALQAEGWCSNPSRDRPSSLKQVSTAPLTNARH